MNKKVFKYLLLLILFLIPISVNATEVTTGTVNAEINLKIRNGPGTNYDQVGSARYNTIVTIKSYSDMGNGCEDKWAYIISSDGVEGYVCSTYITDINTKEIDEEEEKEITELGQKMALMTDEEFDEYLTNQGFLESYKAKLKALHKLHPTWIFKADITKYSWTSALNVQDQSGTSLLNVNPTYAQNGYEGYLSTAEADYDHDLDKFIKHDGTYWFQANRQTIAYYLDPRNFLDEQKIFMFEELFYYPTYQTTDVVKYTLSSDFLKQYSAYFLEAAETSKVSPIYLASLVKQEVGTSTTNICTNGKAGTLSDGVNYTGYYNFYNIGASSSNDPKLKSLQYAKKAGWNTPQKAIVNGSTIISNNYVKCGQHTSYFQKFNLSSKATKPTWHQYTTNISALISPAVSTYNAYKSFGLIEKDFVFSIPVYSNMPESTTLPKLGNPNNWLKSLKVNGSLVNNFDSDTLEYTVNVAYSETIKIEAESVNSKATVKGTGTLNLTGDTTILNVIVTAQNESVRTYKLTINREKKVEVEPPKEDSKEDENENGEIIDEPAPIVDPIIEEPTVVTVDFNEVLKSSGYNYTDKYLSKVTLGTNVATLTNNLIKKYNTVTINIKDKNGKAKTQGTIVTGDKVTLSSNGDTKTVEIVIYGDVDGNGIIDVVDLLYVQKHILGYTKLTGSYLTAASVSKDSKIDVVDILMIQKHLLKVSYISQG